MGLDSLLQELIQGKGAIKSSKACFQEKTNVIRRFRQLK